MDAPVAVIAGGGFGGLSAAKTLRRAPVQIILIDRTNHHLFQPLLYQDGAPVDYDYLILATGARHSYFGHDEFERHAPGLKSLADAVAIRNKVLHAFEQAEAEEDPAAHRDLLTFVLVGAGPAGVEMAAAIAVLVRNTLRSDCRRIDPASARVVLIDMASHAFPRGQEVERGDGSCRARARPAGSHGAGSFGSVRGRRYRDPGSERQTLGGVAQVAIQQGRYAGRLIERRVTGRSAPGPFRYFDKGTMAVVGQGYAVLERGGFHVKGLPAWLAWAALHILFLAQTGLRISVLLQWIGTSLTGQRGSRLIVDHHGSAGEKRAAEAPLAAVSSRC